MTASKTGLPLRPRREDGRWPDRRGVPRGPGIWLKAWSVSAEPGLIVPAAFAGDDVEGGDARVGGLHHDEALADERRNVRLGGERGTPDELALGVVDSTSPRSVTTA